MLAAFAALKPATPVVSDRKDTLGELGGASSGSDSAESANGRCVEGKEAGNGSASAFALPLLSSGNVPTNAPDPEPLFLQTQSQSHAHAQSQAQSQTQSQAKAQAQAKGQMQSQSQAQSRVPLQSQAHAHAADSGAGERSADLATSATKARREHFRKRLLEFYAGIQRHRPQSQSQPRSPPGDDMQPAIPDVEVEVILDVWAGREDELFLELQRKYPRTNAHSNSPNGDDSSC